MMLIHFCMIFIVDFVHTILGANDLPKDFRVDISGNTTKISWTIPSIPKITWTRIYLYNSREDFNGPYFEKGSNLTDIPFPTSSFEIANLTICSEYQVRIKIYKEPHFLGLTNGTFWMIPTPTLSFRPERPFIGNDITFTCNSFVHSCPGKIPSDLSFNFLGNKRGDTDKNILTIHTLAKSDEGMHISCQATDDLGKVFYWSDTVTLDPYYGPDNILLEPGVTAIKVKEKSTLGPLQCTATCNPECTYQWEYNVRGRFEIVPKTMVSNQGRNVTMPQIKRSQTGTYRCHVEHNVSLIHKTTDVSINVQYGPDKVVLDPGSKSINVTENSTLGPIYCTAACNPICTYQWKHNQTGRFEQVESSLLSNQNQTLTVPHIKRSQHGSFRCHVDYQYHHVHTYEISDVSVNVQYGPDKVVLDPGSKSINVTENSTLGPIYCTAACNPICTYQWKHNQTGRFEQVESSLLSNQNQTLTVPHIKRSQHGSFRCHVDYQYHHVHTYEISDVSVNVQYGPDRIILEPASTYINVKEGNTLGTIHCAAACNPDCTYRWEYNVTGRFTFVPFELVSNQGRTLTVSQIQRSQTGTYRCHVNNYFTQIKMTAEVLITVQVFECPTKGFHAVTSSMFGVGIATLVVGLGALISATTFFIVTRVKTRNVRSNVSDGYIETQRSNPVFADSYSTLQSNSESRPTQNPSSDMYEECGIAHGRSNYENI